MSHGLIVNAPAKLNLYLGIHPEKNERGYHRVDTIMTALELSDTVEIMPAPSWSFTCSEPFGCAEESNTLFSAAQMLSSETGNEPNFSVNVVKRIPSQAGLGGGSSDGAAMLAGLCSFWDIDPHSQLVLSIAQELGADVSFFLYEGPALMQGVGATYVRSFPEQHLNCVLVKRTESAVSTQRAYEVFDEMLPEPGDLTSIVQALEDQDIPGVLSSVSNNLGVVAEKIEPGVEDALAWLAAREGVQGVSVCGSGSCVVGFCDRPLDAKQIADDAKEAGFWGYATKTTPQGVTIQPTP